MSAQDMPSHAINLQPIHGDLERLVGAPLVAISSVKFAKLNRYEGTRFRASLDGSNDYRDADVPHVVMCDRDSDPAVADGFGKRGDIVFETLRPGIAFPYLDAAYIVRAVEPKAAVLKAEADKRLSAKQLREFQRASTKYDVVVGDRTSTSMKTMAATQELTESTLDPMIAEYLGVPRGVTSGVQVYSPRGLSALLVYEQFINQLGDNWKYLMVAPLWAHQHRMKVIGLPTEVTYDEAVAIAEDTDPAQVLRRLAQMPVMLEGALQVAKLLGVARRADWLAPSAGRRQQADNAINLLRGAVAR